MVQWRPVRRRTARKPQQRPEQELQRRCADIMREAVPPPPHGPFWNAVNPVPAKSRAVAGISKAMGLRPGVPDFDLLQLGLSIRVEFKDAENGRLSTEQRKRRQEIIEAGGVFHECRSVVEYIEILRGHGIPVRLSDVERVMGSRWMCSEGSSL